MQTIALQRSLRARGNNATMTSTLTYNELYCKSMNQWGLFRQGWKMLYNVIIKELYIFHVPECTTSLWFAVLTLKDKNVTPHQCKKYDSKTVQNNTNVSS